MEKKLIDSLKTIVAYIPMAGLMMVVFSLPFYYSALQRIGLYIYAAGFFMDYAVNRRWSGWTWSRDKWPYLFFLLFYLCLPLRQLFAPSHTSLYDAKLDGYFPFLCVGLMGLMEIKNPVKLKYIPWVMMVSCMVVSGMLLWGMRGSEAACFSDWLNEAYLLRIQRVHSHMGVNLYCNIALVFGFWFIMRVPSKRWTKIVMGLLMLNAAALIALSEGRIGQLTLVLILVLMPMVYAVLHRQWGLLSMGVVALCAGLLIYNVNPRFHEISMKENPRKYIWPVAVEIIKEKPLFGHGVSSARQELITRGNNNVDYYSHYTLEYQLTAPVYENGEINYQSMHPHNAFLETAMESGLVGCAILLLCLILPVICSPVGKDTWFLAATIGAFGMQAMMESFGAFLLTLWLPLLTLLWYSLAQSHKACA